MHTEGKVDRLLPMLIEVGFSIIHPLTPEANDIAAIQTRWGNELVLAGNFPTSLLLDGSDDEIDQRVQTLCQGLGPSGGYIFSTAGVVSDGIPPGKYMTMVKALHRHGRFSELQPARPMADHHD